jgi:hypothetical protein
LAFPLTKARETGSDPSLVSILQVYVFSEVPALFNYPVVPGKNA